MVFLVSLLALLPGFAWLYFYLREDEDHPEPILSIVKTFIAGGACAFVALFIQIALQHAGITFGGSDFGETSFRLIIAIILFSLVEELVKFGAAYVSVSSDPAFDEPVDAMIYMIVAALGFATIENIGAVQRDIGVLPATQIFGVVLETLTLRFVGATLLHTLSSGLIGYYWALEIRSFKSGRILATGIMLGTILHAIFNYLIISYGNLIYAVAFVVVMGISILGDFEKLKLKPL